MIQSSYFSCSRLVPSMYILPLPWLFFQESNSTTFLVVSITVSTFLCVSCSFLNIQEICSKVMVLCKDKFIARKIPYLSKYQDYCQIIESWLLLNVSTLFYFFNGVIILGHIPVMSGPIQFLNWINTQKLNDTQTLYH